MKIGKELGMKESHGGGLANHTGPEPCMGTGNSVNEALTGVRAGWVLSPEIWECLSGAVVLLTCGGNTAYTAGGEGCADPAGSETPGVHGSLLRGSREALRLALGDRSGVRTENPKGARP